MGLTQEDQLHPGSRLMRPTLCVPSVDTSTFPRSKVRVWSARSRVLISTMEGFLLLHLHHLRVLCEQASPGAVASESGESPISRRNLSGGGSHTPQLLRGCAGRACRGCDRRDARRSWG